MKHWNTESEYVAFLLDMYLQLPVDPDDKHDGLLVQDCSIATAETLKILQSCTKPSNISISFGVASLALQKEL